MYNSDWLQNVYGVILGGVIGHALCTGVAVLGGRMIAQRISVRTGNKPKICLKNFSLKNLLFFSSYNNWWCGVSLICLFRFVHRPQHGGGGGEKTSVLENSVIFYQLSVIFLFSGLFGLDSVIRIT